MLKKRLLRFFTVTFLVLAISITCEAKEDLFPVVHNSAMNLKGVTNIAIAEISGESGSKKGPFSRSFYCFILLIL